MSVVAPHRIDLGAHLEMTALTDTGRKRPHNEDRVGSDVHQGVALLADGMGGHKGGEVASGLAVETLLHDLVADLPRVEDFADDPDGYAPETVLARTLVERANGIIHDTAQSQPQYEGMGTTLVLMLFYDDRLTIAHVGDSRAYRMRDGRLEQVTRDHTLMQELIDRGFYTPEEARASLNRNIVTRALGIEPQIRVDVQEDMALPGDLYLLCSDGLHDMVDDARIRLTLSENGASLDQAARSLVDQANENGGNDNISVILVRVLKPFPSRRSWFRRFADWFQ